MKHIKLLIISIILFVPALPTFNIYFFAWIAFVPYFIVVLLSKRKVMISCIYGLLLGSVVYGFSMFLNEGGIFLRLLTFLGLVLLQIILFGIYGLFIKIIDSFVKSIFKKQILIAIAWVVIEFIALKFFYGAAIYPGLTQHNNFLILPLARYIGLYGISFLVMLSNSYLANLYLKYRDESIFLKDIIIPVIICLLFITGYLINSNYREDSITKELMDIVIIQGNISISEYEIARNYPTEMKKIFTKYMDMSLEAVNIYNPDIVVWPETAVHRWALRLKEYREEIFAFAENNKVYLILGVPDLNEFDEEYNSVFIVSPDERVCGKYDKSILIPVWEKAFLPGRIKSPIYTEKFSAAINICFESFFPDIAAEQIKKGADFLFVLSNNGMLGYTLAPYFSSAFSVFRAVENNIYVVQSMNTGVSQIVSQEGQVLVKSALFTEKVINFNLPINDRKITFYTCYGETIYLVITIIFILYMFYLRLNTLILRAFNINKLKE